jgi:hypothetical protein
MRVSNTSGRFGRRGEYGFTAIEALVAIALFVALGFATLLVTRAFLGATAASATSAAGTLTLEAQIDEWRSEAATAFAVFIPATDVMGRPNQTGATPHEVDFYARTDSAGTMYWAYYYDAAAQTLRRFDYDLSGRRGEADRTTGAIDTSAQYPVLPNVTSFTVATVEANMLTGPASAYASAIQPLFGSATPKPLPVGFDDGGPPRTDLYGGNTTVQLQITAAHGSRSIELSSGAMPSGFTVHAYPQIRATVYRVDQTHRGCLGLCQRSHVWIDARLEVSYDNWRTQPPIVWCDFNLYGYPQGLVQGDPAENYHPEWFTESTAGIVYDVTHGETPGKTCSRTPPPNSTNPQDDEPQSRTFSRVDSNS